MYSCYIYTDRAAIAKTQAVYSQNTTKTYEYKYGTGQQKLSSLEDGSYVTFTAVPADGYKFTQWTYHIGEIDPDNPLTSTSNPFKYYGSEGNDIYIAAEGSLGEPTGIPTVTGCYIQTTPGSRDITVKITGTNIIGYNLWCHLSLSGDNQTYSTTITSNSFSTIITARDYTATAITVRFATGTSYVKAWIFQVELEDYFQWSSAVYSGGIVKNVSHTEWDNFIDKIKEVLTDKGNQNQTITESKYGYAIGTTYSTMLNDCYLQYDADLQGYPLTAKKFNVARFIIGSNVSTGISDKTSKSSKVLASDFITLAECLKTMQEST